jgi:hypothetical protein
MEMSYRKSQKKKMEMSRKIEMSNMLIEKEKKKKRKLRKSPFATTKR